MQKKIVHQKFETIEIEKWSAFVGMNNGCLINPLTLITGDKYEASYVLANQQRLSSISNLQIIVIDKMIISPFCQVFISQ